MNTIFADIASNISVAAGVVRIDYAILSGSDKETKEVKFAHSHTLVMSLDGFLRSLEMQEQIKEQLIQSGILIPKNIQNSNINNNKGDV